MKKEETKEEVGYFTVKVECMVPATAIYHIHAKTPEEAFKISRRKQPVEIQYGFGKKADKRVQVTDFKSTLIRWIKNFF
jgi:hypothetical protein